MAFAGVVPDLDGTPGTPTGFGQAEAASQAAAKLRPGQGRGRTYVTEQAEGETTSGNAQGVRSGARSDGAAWGREPAV
ncbi:MAG: hypothetical protein AB1390_09275 [Nitrospirota bacterium]